MIYPVDTTERYDLWDSSTISFVATNRQWPRADGGEMQGLAENLVPLLRVIAPDPVYDPATHRLGGYGEAVVDVVAQTSTYTREVIALTQEQLDARAEQVADDAERDLLKQAYQVFKAGTATNAQAQRAIAWLIKTVGGGL